MDALFQEVEAMPHSRRLLALRNCSRFATPALCSALTEHAFAARFGPAQESVRWAEAAVIVADRLQPLEGPVADIAARAWCTLGNARRISGDLRRADAAFVRAADLRMEGTGATDLLDRFESQLGTLRVYQRRFEEARALLCGLAARRRASGDRIGEARALLKLGLALLWAEDVEVALEFLDQAQVALQRERDRPLQRLVFQAVTACYIRLDCYHQAEGLWTASALLFLDAEPSVAFCRQWQLGLIDIGLGDLDQALLVLGEVRQALAKESLGFDACLASLDMARCHFLRSELGEARAVLLEAVEILVQVGVPREILAALRGLVQVEDCAKAAARLVRLDRKVRALAL
jgi:tetratricopeptide (TPR) repeat protein